MIRYGLAHVQETGSGGFAPDQESRPTRIRRPVDEQRAIECYEPAGHPTNILNSESRQARRPETGEPD